jgi:hypothetical protein
MFLLGGVSLFLFVMAFAGGVAVERIRFDQQRATMLHRYDEAIRQWHQLRMAVERLAEARPEGIEHPVDGRAGLDR